MPRRFANPKPTLRGRIGHPGAEAYNLISCAGVTFFDNAMQKKWTYRKYDPHKGWQGMDVWTVQVYMRPTRRGQVVGSFGPQTPVRDQDVPDEVRAFGVAELVRLRLRGKVFA